MCQETYVCRDSVYNENLESLQTDLRRGIGLQLCRDLLTVFCNENLSTRSPWALFISRISRALRIWVSRKIFSSLIILLADELVLVEIQNIRDRRPIFTIFEYMLTTLLLKISDTIIERSILIFLLHKFRSCLIEQLIFVVFKKRSFWIWWLNEFKNRTLELTPRIVTPYGNHFVRSPGHSQLLRWTWHQAFSSWVISWVRCALDPLSLSRQCHEVEVCRGNEVSEREVIMMSFFDIRANFFWKILAWDRLVCVDLSEYQFNRTETGCKNKDK